MGTTNPQLEEFAIESIINQQTFYFALDPPNNGME